MTISGIQLEIDGEIARLTLSGIELGKTGQRGRNSPASEATSFNPERLGLKPAKRSTSNCETRKNGSRTKTSLGEFEKSYAIRD
jgi:hypothetical protein